MSSGVGFVDTLVNVAKLMHNASPGAITKSDNRLAKFNCNLNLLRIPMDRLHLERLNPVLVEFSLTRVLQEDKTYKVSSYRESWSS